MRMRRSAKAFRDQKGVLRRESAQFSSCVIERAFSGLHDSPSHSDAKL